MKKNLFIGLITSLLILAFALTAVNNAQAAQVTFQSAAAASDVTNTTTLPVTYPSGIQANDLILMQIVIRSTTVGVTTPTGWTLLYGPDTAGTSIRQWIFYRIPTDGSLSGTTLNVTVGSGNVLKMGRMYLFRNTDSSNFTESGGFGSGTGNTISAQSVTTTGIERLAVSFVFVDDDNALDPFADETGGDWTEGVAEYTTTSGADGAMGLQIATMATAGTISGGTDTMGASDTWGVRAFALKPPPPTGTPDHLAFSQPPTAATAGVAISPNVKVQIQNSSNQVIDDDTTVIRLYINTGSGTLTGDSCVAGICTLTALNGEVEFTNLKIDTGGTGDTTYTLKAVTTNLTPNLEVTSTSFVIRGPSKLAFSVEPPLQTAVNVAMNPAIQVQIQDSLGNLVPIATNSVTIAIDTNPGGGTLSGTLTFSAVAGVATFDNLSINQIGTGYTLKATSAGLSPDPISIPFTIIAGTFGSTVCAADRFGGNIGCVAGDVRITNITIASTTPMSSCTAGDTITVDLDVTINFNQAGKYDVGVFMSNDGLDPQNTVANGGAKSCKINTLPITAAAAAPWPPFEDLDGPTDTCGEGSSGLSNKLRMSNVIVKCQTVSRSPGNLYIPFVVSWDVNKTPPGKVCTSIADPVPSAQSKCNSPTQTDLQFGVIMGTSVVPLITKTDNKTTLLPGTNTTYTVAVTNTTGIAFGCIIPSTGAITNSNDCVGKSEGDVCGASNNGICRIPLFKDVVYYTGNPPLSFTNATCCSLGGATCPCSGGPYVCGSSTCNVSTADMQGSGLPIPYMPGSSPQAITNISQANPARVTYSGADTFANGDRVIISDVVGMTEVNDREFTVTNVIGGNNTFDLSGLNSAGYTAYSSGGTILKVSSLTFSIQADVSSNPPATYTNTARAFISTLSCSDGTGNCVDKKKGDTCSDDTGTCILTCSDGTGSCSGLNLGVVCSDGSGFCGAYAEASDSQGGTGGGGSGLYCSDGSGSCEGINIGQPCSDGSGTCDRGGSRVKVIKWREVFR